MSRHLFVRLAIVAMLLQVRGAASAAPLAQAPRLYVEPRRAWYTPQDTDLVAAVGASHTQYAFALRCEGAQSVHVTVSNDNPHLTPSWTQQTMQCGSQYLLSFTFSPTEPGPVQEPVTFTWDAGVVVSDLRANGVPVEPATFWTADLGEGSVPQQIVVDPLRRWLYISDLGNDEVIVFDPIRRRVEARIPVGIDPVGMALAPDGEALWVANSGERSLSVVDLDRQEETVRVELPSLYPNPNDDYQSYYTPYSLTFAAPTRLLLGSLPPGLASGGPIYQLDLPGLQLTPREDQLPPAAQNLWGRTPVFRTSRDRSTTALVLEPGSSPTVIVVYDPATDTMAARSLEIERSLTISADGSRIVVTTHDLAIESADLTVLDHALEVLHRISTIGQQPLAAVLSPFNDEYLYVLSDRSPHLIEEVRLDQAIQTRALRYTPPDGYYPAPHHALEVSPDGQWLYAPLCQTWCEPPGKLLAVRVGPVPSNDEEPPRTQVEPLAPTQATTWWVLRWAGQDDQSGIDHFELEYRVGAEGDWLPWLSTSRRSALFSGALPDETYCFRVRAVDWAGLQEPDTPGAEVCTIAGADASGLSGISLPLVTRVR